MNQCSGRLIEETSGAVYDLDEVSTIGRNRTAEVVISDPRVSRRHAMIRRQDDGFWFFDLGSINGSYINGRRVTTSQLLNQGDLLRIAESTYRFEGSNRSADLESDTATEATLIQLQSVKAILLVSDIQGFTKLSERLNPDQIAPIIGSWYERTERILARYEANLDKFQGDSVLAYWLHTSPENRLAALHTAAAMQEACEEVRRQHHAVLSREGLDFRSGTAIHLGPTAYGSFGSKEFTLIGDAVNVVFRLEAMTRTLGARILVGGDLFDGWEEGRGRCNPLGTHAVKGRSAMIEVYSFEPTSAKG